VILPSFIKFACQTPEKLHKVTVDTDIKESTNSINLARRPIKTRQSKWAKRLTEMLVKRGISANSISLTSMIFATIGCLSFILAGQALPWWLGMLIGIVGIQGRLICNLLDGMVAEKDGFKSPIGKIMNEVPDRYSDIVLLVGAGVAIDQLWLGWMAACSAVLTAYIRSYIAELSGEQDFGGPMAKPQRMFFLSLGALCAIVYPKSLLLALWIIAVGSFLTAILRLKKAVKGLIPSNN